MAGEDGLSKTLLGVDDEQELQQTIQEIRELLDGFSALEETEQ